MPQESASIQAFCRQRGISALVVFFLLWGFLVFAQESTREERILSTAITNALHSRPALSGCALLLDTSSGKILAKNGDLERHRDPGSTLKPFIYAEALQRGYITAQSILHDGPLRIDDYEVRNYDGKYYGDLTATTALAQSLNVPAVHILCDAISLEDFHSILQEIGILEPMDISPFPGYRVATGGIPVTPTALAQAYAGLYRNAFPRWAPGVTAMLLKMMRALPLPNATRLDISWKTGTSQGNRDAWCLAVTPEYTLCIWFGRENFSSDPTLEGRALAAPVAGAVLTALYQEESPRWPAALPGIISCELCAKSGLRPTADCQQRLTGQRIDGIELRVCDRCGEDSPYHILHELEE